MAEFYVILTQAGLDAVAAAVGAGPKVDFAQLAVGDSNGAYYEPLPGQVALVNERWRGAVNRVYVHVQNPNWVVVEAIIPAAVGGWDVREAALFGPGAPGTLLALAKYPLTAKPAPGSGSEKDLYVRLVLQVTNGGEVVQVIDPTLVMATQAYADAHSALTSPHQATPAPTPDRLLVRDAAGRAQVLAPAAAADIARKAEVDAHANLTSPHSATSAATPSRLVVRDAAGRAQVAAPAVAADIARKAEVDAHANARAAGVHGVYAGSVDNTGALEWELQPAAGWGLASVVYGEVIVTHNFGTLAYAVTATVIQAASEQHYSATIKNKGTNSFTVVTHRGSENFEFYKERRDFDFVVVRGA